LTHTHTKTQAENLHKATHTRARTNIEVGGGNNSTIAGLEGGKRAADNTKNTHKSDSQAKRKHDAAAATVMIEGWKGTIMTRSGEEGREKYVGHLNPLALTLLVFYYTCLQSNNEINGGNQSIDRWVG
jgi:hypothetical protein